MSAQHVPAHDLHRVGTGSRRRTGLLAVPLALAAVAWGGNQFTPLLVMYRHVAGYSSQTVTVLLAAYVIGIVPALLFGGPLSDRYGRRPLMYPAPVIAAAGSAALAAGADSVVLLFAGRMLSGVALGLGMAVGTSWLKELVQRNGDPGPTAGAGRASAALTAGFAVGAAVAAALAQFAPWPEVLAYLLHIVLAVVAAAALVGSPETRPRRLAAPRGRLLADLIVPRARQRRFLLVVLPMAPFVFGLASAAYAILPGLLGGRLAPLGTAISGLHCLIGLSCGMAIQSLGSRLGRRGPGRPIILGLALGVIGLLLGATVIPGRHLVGYLVAAAVLGSAYGLLMIAGLQEVHRMAGPDDLAGLTAVYYGLSYVGFITPAALAALSRELSYPVMFAGGAGVAAVAAVVVLLGLRITRRPDAEFPHAPAAEPLALSGAGVGGH
jgi:MFS family permease